MLVSTLICDAILICLRPKKEKKKRRRPEIGEIVQALSQMASLFIIIVRWRMRSWVQDPLNLCVITLKQNYQNIKNSNSIPKKKGGKKPQKLAKI